MERKKCNFCQTMCKARSEVHGMRRTAYIVMACFLFSGHAWASGTHGFNVMVASVSAPALYQNTGGIAASPQQSDNRMEVTGVVVDENGESLPGVNILLKGTQVATITDMDGKFIMKVPTDKMGGQLVFSFVGMQTVEQKLNKSKLNYKVTMHEDSKTMEDVVVTGYFQRKKVSQTGSEVVVGGDELRQVGSLNLLQAISAFDPGVRTLENNEFGSDPNRVPEITVRGEKGFDLRDEADDSRTNPNAPLYIMDGIEVTATTVYDMDMNRIASFSILKDAAATSLYGSRGANGVILITTVRPEPGQIRVTLNSNFNISIPDLRSYNLMNAREKLEYERLAGLYTNKYGNKEEQTLLDIKYNKVLSEIERGVDTYWLSQPLTTSVNQRYSCFPRRWRRPFPLWYQPEIRR